jgi:hypothetical protein
MEKKVRQGFYFFRRKFVFPSLFSCPLLRRNRSRGRQETGELRAEIRGEPVQAKEKKRKSSFFPSLLPSDVCVLFSSFFARLALALLLRVTTFFVSLFVSRAVVFLSPRCRVLVQRALRRARFSRSVWRPRAEARRTAAAEEDGEGLSFFRLLHHPSPPGFFLCPSAATTDLDKHRLPAARSSFHCHCYPRVSIKRLILMTSKSRKKE